MFFICLLCFFLFYFYFFFFFSSRRRHTRLVSDWSSDVCSSDLDELQLSLIADRPDFIVPGNGARITLGRSNGEDVFTGYLTQAPAFEYLGWGERGPVYRYNLVAQGDVVLLDRKQIPNSPPFVNRNEGDALRLN